jgi:hypothetical protein
MPKSAQKRTPTRAPRVRLGGTVLSLMRLENGRQLRGRLHALSTTGGLLQVDSPLNEGIKVELVFHVGRTTIRGKARMLFPMWATHGCLQPFKFDGLGEEDVRKLEVNLQTFLESAFPS